MPYTPASPKQVTDQENLNRIKFMNTNTIQVITTTVAVGLLAGFTGLEVTGNLLTGMAIGVSYFTVASLIAMAASDYRTGPKPYFAAPVVTGDFQRVAPASVALRAPSAKARVAA
jgi:hypothetical protein